MMTASEVIARAASIRLIALDSDGTLTDGGVYVLADGGEFRRFDVRDGLGIVRALRAGISIAVISAGRGGSVEARARQLGIPDCLVGVADKRAALEGLCARDAVTHQQVAFMGDDVNDLPVFEAVGLACALPMRCPMSAHGRTGSVIIPAAAVQCANCVIWS